MQLKALLDGDDAVSPVIGVILMVAITVILAAVIASFVLGLGEDAASTTPQASFSFDYNNGSSHDSLAVTHESGDTIEPRNINASVSGAHYHNSGENQLTFGGSASGDGDLFTSTVNAGASDTLDQTDFHDGGGGTSWTGSNTLDLSGSTVRLTYNDPSNDQSSTLQSWTGPEA